MRAVFNGEIYNFAELRARAERARPPARAPTATPRRSCTSTRSTAPTSPQHLRGMFGDRPLGRARAAGSCSPATAWASSRCTGRETPRRARVRLGGQVADRRRPRRGRSSTRSPPSCSSPTASSPGRARCSRACTSSRPPPSWSGRTAAWSTSAPTGTRTGRRTDAAGPSLAEDTEQLLELLRDGDRRARMVTDVPLGVMLSGGLDSSLITALMAERSDAARADVLDRLRRGRRLQRARRRAARGRAARHRPPRADDERGRPPGPARRGAVAPRGARSPTSPASASCCSAGSRARR